ncbi:MAG: gliding motility-associated C-terminal domain-containing protein [Bacteroidetes bacterium]|nr:gliding motility-associated C-terminal domain-containing protein [Bacteroidota bacterium]
MKLPGVKYLISLFFIISIFPGYAQLTGGKNDTINPGVPVTLSATYGLIGIGISSKQNNEDWVQGPFPIGFGFSFFGDPYSEFWVGANGWISFSPNPNSNGIREAFFIPSAAPNNPKKCICGPFQDLYPTMDGSPFIFYQTIGTAPNRKLVVMWCECPMYICTDLTVTFQIVLNEADSTIENHIFRKPACPDNYSNKATLGLQDGTGYVGFAVPGYNATSWSSDTMAWKYVPTSVDSFQIVRIPYKFQPITPGDKISFRWYAGAEYLSDQQSITVAPEETTIYTVYCTLCSGMEFKAEVIVFVVPYIPNSFTPNGDGVNDNFKIIGLPFENITLFNLQIFNRWGQSVFYTNDIRDSWDGKQNGEYCPEGYYVWVIYYEDNKKTKTSNKGTLMLLR